MLYTLFRRGTVVKFIIIIIILGLRPSELSCNLGKFLEVVHVTNKIKADDLSAT
jgi:hypothetical protein